MRSQLLGGRIRLGDIARGLIGGRLLLGDIYGRLFAGSPRLAGVVGARLRRVAVRGQFRRENDLRSPAGGLDRDGAARVLALPGDRVLGLQLGDSDFAEGAEVLREALNLAQLLP